jgi:protein-tyrosine-phosphatase
VCTGNQCRSPIAEGLLRRRLEAWEIDATVGSAGTVHADVPATREAIEAVARRGIDISHHRSRVLNAADVRRSDLIIGMTRHHVREAVLLSPEAFTRSFTLRELVRRADTSGGRRPQEPLERWLARVGTGRSLDDLVGKISDDDVADPMGQPPATYEAVAAELEELVERLIAHVWPTASPDRARTRSGRPHTPS